MVFQVKKLIEISNTLNNQSQKLTSEALLLFINISRNAYSILQNLYQILIFILLAVSKFFMRNFTPVFTQNSLRTQSVFAGSQSFYLVCFYEYEIKLCHNMI